MVIPTFRYKNAPLAIEWLCQAFGFSKHLIVEGEHGRIDHAQLKYGDSMIMVSSVKDSEYDKHLKHPKDINGFNTNSPYLVINDIDAHYETAKGNGADIVLELEEQHYGGKLYTCKDIEGYLWNFGSYDPTK